jgi:biotin-(acetyl-CoA carboxylase) ligase
MDILSVEELYKNLKTRVLGRRAVVLGTVDSTNAEVRRMLERDPVEGAAVIADRQTGGKGRRGRRWVSEPGCGLWMTFAAKAALPPEEIQRITLAAGVAVCRAVEDSTGGAAKPLIKWPNDVLIEGRKICGILCETVNIPFSSMASRYPHENPPNSPVGHSPFVRGARDCGCILRSLNTQDRTPPYEGGCRELAAGGLSPEMSLLSDRGDCSTAVPEGASYIIAGIGVNTRRPPNGWVEAEGVAIPLEEAAGMVIPRMRLAAEILNNMEDLLDKLFAGGFAAIAQEYRKRMLPPGGEIVIVDGEQSRRGRIEGVDDAGGLLVRLENRELERIVSGEITMRGVGGYV